MGRIADQRDAILNRNLLSQPIIQHIQDVTARAIGDLEVYENPPQSL